MVCKGCHCPIPIGKRCTACAEKRKSEFALAIILLIFMVGLIIILSGCSSTPTTQPKFREGDVAQAFYWRNHPQYEGELVTVTGGFRWRWVKELQGNAMRVYEVQTSDGKKFAAQEFQLKRVSR